MSERAPSEFRRWSLLLPMGAVALAAAAQGWHVFSEVPRSRGPHLAQAVPADPPGWTVREIPLGPTEFIASEAGKILNFDEVLNREYSRAGENFGVYVAYWGAGKMPTRLVASHTPDRCWTENGWRCLEMRFKQTGLFEGAAFQPAEWRLFEPPHGGRQTYVLYWHLVEGRTYDYGGRFNDVPSPVLWAKDALQQALLGSREQYFIRLTSSQPLENLGTDPGFVSVMQGLGRLGLAAGSPPLPVP